MEAGGRGWGRGPGRVWVEVAVAEEAACWRRSGSGCVAGLRQVAGGRSRHSPTLGPLASCQTPLPKGAAPLPVPL